MSVIAGILHHDQRATDREVLGQMVEHSAPWPAEAVGVWCEGSIGLGHRMLHDTPESRHERQPFLLEGLAVTADARIDNRAELLGLFGLASPPSAPVTDVELIARAYEKWGEAAPIHLLGDFAFAVWDRRRRELFCARDPFSIRPFFYCVRDEFFAFSSSIQALLTVPGVPRELNELYLACTIVQSYQEKEQTFYQGIRRLPGGCSFTISNGTLRQRVYWDPADIKEIHLHRDEEYADGLREIFTEAVRCRLRCAAPVGSMLSGGLDSSSIVCMARQLLDEAGRGPLHTFSAIFPTLRDIDARIDERRYIKAVVDGGRVIHHEVRADLAQPLVEPLWASDEAIAAPNFYMDWVINKCAAVQGVRVLFSGFDGDTAISHGYELLSDLTFHGRWIKLYREARALARRMNCPLRRILRAYCIDPLVPDILFDFWHRLRGTKPAEVFEGTLINPAFAQRVHLDAHLERSNHYGLCAATSARQVHQQAVTSGLMVNCLEYGRRASDDAGIYQVYPYFDRRLVEFCVGMPADQKLKAGIPRYAMVQAMRSLLPPEVGNRRYKGNLSSNFNRHMQNSGLSAAREIVKHQPRIIETLFNRRAIDEMLRRVETNPQKNCGDTINLFFMIILTRWLSRMGWSQG